MASRGRGTIPGETPAEGDAGTHPQRKATPMTPRLLDHPFYRAWIDGTVTPAQLADYHASYAQFIDAIPRYWQRVVDALDRDSPVGAAIVDEERQHIALWERWRTGLPETSRPHGMDDICEHFDALPPAALLGALHAFEVQQPEVALTKREGLIRWYGCAEADVTYFDAHLAEEPHLEYGRDLAARLVSHEEFEAGFARSAEVLFTSLDRFLDT